MPPTIDSLLFELVGVEMDTPAFRDLHRAVTKALAAYPHAKSLLDWFETVQLKQLQRLRDALRALVKADAELDDAARFALEGLRMADNDLVGLRVIDDDEDHSPPDVRAFAAGMEIALNDAITELEWATTIDGRGKKRRRTEAGRAWVLCKLAHAFQQHYQLDPKDYPEHLADFLRGERLLNWFEDVCERIAAALALARQREREQHEQDAREEFARQLRRRRVWFPGDF